MQNFGVTNKEHYGMLWYFLEWSIVFICLFFFIRLNHMETELSEINLLVFLSCLVLNSEDAIEASRAN